MLVVVLWKGAVVQVFQRIYTREVIENRLDIGVRLFKTGASKHLKRERESIY